MIEYLPKLTCDDAEYWYLFNYEGDLHPLTKGSLRPKTAYMVLAYDNSSHCVFYSLGMKKRDDVIKAFEAYRETLS